jgi:hypothetical protein
MCKSFESGFEEYAWDTLLLAPMDAGCLAFVVQTVDVLLMVQTFARLAHSPQSTYRANRRYLYLPSKQIPDDMFETLIRELYETREMDFMPDVVIAKLINGNKYTSQTSGTAVWLTGEQ